MGSEDKKAFALAVGAMLETFGVEATKEIMLGYWLGLSDLDVAQLENAVAQAIKTCKFVPKPADLRKLAGVSIDPEAMAIAAWSDVVGAIQKLGSYKHVDFQDKICNAAIRNLGGWVAFIDRVNEDEEWSRKDFIKAYTNFSASGVDGEACRPLAGLAQCTVFNGEVVPCKPILIRCDNERAALNYRIKERDAMFSVPSSNGEDRNTVIAKLEALK